MFDHLFESIEERSRWIVLYAEFISHVWAQKLTLDESIMIAEKILLQDEANKKIRFTAWELEHFTTSKLTRTEIERGYKNVYPINYILDKDDYVVFGFTYNGREHDTIIVSNITEMYDDKVLCHFLYGHHSLSEFVKKTDILGLGATHSEKHQYKTEKIPGWTNTYRIFLKERLNKIQNAKSEY